MGEPASRFAVLRFSGELSIKARGTRTHFRRRLLMNLRDALASEGLAPRVEVSHERLYVELPGDGAGAGESFSLREHALARVFGISSVSLAVRHAVVETDDVVRTGAAIFREAVRGKRFAVRARRVGERHTVRAERMEVERRLGAALLPFAAGVDLVAPETTAHVELSSGGTAYFSERTQGPSGLPLGVEGRAVALLSGGFDSAVAAWQMQRRGVALDPVFCNLGGASHLRGAARVAKVLADRWSYGERPVLHAIDFEPVAAAIRAHTEARFWQVLLKRSMLRAAAAEVRARPARLDRELAREAQHGEARRRLTHRPPSTPSFPRTCARAPRRARAAPRATCRRTFARSASPASPIRRGRGRRPERSAARRGPAASRRSAGRSARSSAFRPGR